VTGAQGAQGATGAPGPSDSRLKKNVREIESPLDKVQKMRGVSFIWNNQVDENPLNDIGFIAQEIAHVFPELVFKANDNENSMYMVKYNDVVAVCLEAIKEQSNMLNNSLTKLERLEGLVTEKGY
jgi:gamma-glutamylcysteine synthetase